MLVTWNQANLLSVYLQPKQGQALEAIKLLPGMNEVEDKTWKQVEEHPAVKKHIEMGNLELVDRPSDDNKKAREGLAMFDVGASKKLVKKTYDKVLLGKWKEKEERQAVLASIDEQLKYIEESTKPVKKDEEKPDDDED